MKINKYDEDIGLFLFIISIMLIFILLLYGIEYLRYDKACLNTERITVTADDYTLLNIYIQDERLPYDFYYKSFLDDKNITNPNHIAFRLYPNNTNQTLRIDTEYNQTMTFKEHNQSFYKPNCRRF